MRLNHERSLFENRSNCSPSELHGGSLFKTFNSYSFNFNGGLRRRRTGFCLLRTPSPRGKQFLWFLNIDLLQFHRIYLLFDWNKLFLICLLRINLPNLCPNMIHVEFFLLTKWRISAQALFCVFCTLTLMFVYLFQRLLSYLVSEFYTYKKEMSCSIR